MLHYIITSWRLCSLRSAIERRVRVLELILPLTIRGRNRGRLRALPDHRTEWVKSQNLLLDADANELTAIADRRLRALAFC